MSGAPPPKAVSLSSRLAPPPLRFQAQLTARRGAGVGGGVGRRGRR